jgi:hypothetical protein
MFCTRPVLQAAAETRSPLLEVVESCRVFSGSDYIQADFECADSLSQHGRYLYKYINSNPPFEMLETFAKLVRFYKLLNPRKYHKAEAYIKLKLRLRLCRKIILA